MLKYVGLSGSVALFSLLLFTFATSKKLTYVFICNHVLNTQKPCFMSSFCIIISAVNDFCRFQKLTSFSVANDVLNREIVCFIGCSSVIHFLQHLKASTVFTNHFLKLQNYIFQAVLSLLLFSFPISSNSRKWLLGITF